MSSAAWDQDKNLSTIEEEVEIERLFQGLMRDLDYNRIQNLRRVVNVGKRETHWDIFWMYTAISLFILCFWMMIATFIWKGHIWPHARSSSIFLSGGLNANRSNQTPDSSSQ